ncbi:MAG: hypothetical protein AAF604_08985 [Acidobacteriota bacterium]
MNQPHSPAPPAKKGLHPLAWVAIGCVGLLLVTAVLFTIGGIFVGKKVNEFAGGFEDNPALAAAEMIVRLNPELELVESDPEAGTLTILESKTGKTVTVNLEDVQEGRFGFETSDGQSTSVTFSDSAGGMQVTQTDDSGTTSEVRIGGGATRNDAPDWVPAYPGYEATNAWTTSNDSGSSGSFAIQTDESSEDLEAFYRQAFEDLGIKPERSSFSGGGQALVALNGKSDDGSRELTATIVDQGNGKGAMVTVVYQDKP